MRKSVALVLAMAATLHLGADTWRAHPPFGEEVVRVIDAGESIYAATLCQPYTPGSASNGVRVLSLWQYEKGANQWTALSQNNLLSSPAVTALEWFSATRTLAVGHPDGEIRLVGTDGNSKRITALRDLNAKDTKRVASLSLSPDGKTLYAGTPFGYVTLGLETGRIGEVVRLGREVTGFKWEGGKATPLFEEPENEKEGATLLVAPPAAPKAFRTDQMTVHPDGRLLVANHGHNALFPLDDNGGRLSLTAYDGVRWQTLTSPATQSRPLEPLTNPNGPSVDPSHPSLVWFGSVLNGLERIDIGGREQPLHLSRTGDPHRNQLGFHAIVGDQTAPGSWKESCSFTAPVFDAEGNMWSVHADYDNQTPPAIHLFVWEKDTDPTSPSLLVKEGPEVSNIALLIALKKGKSKGKLLYCPRLWGGRLTLIDPMGTPMDGEDDETVRFSSMTDQDGNDFEPERIYFLEEDADGTVWAGCSRGVFRFDPSDSRGSELNVTRVKVGRGDGSGYADYLLDGVPVTGMATDGAGHRWFATSGAGVVVTATDGRTVLREYTSANSPLPGNTAYGIAWIPATGSLMVSTEAGLQELFPSIAAGDDSGSKGPKVWPNPVRPGFTGYVTIEGLPGEGTVKILDSAGRLVSRLQAGPDGRALWDVTDNRHRRPGSGVYRIVASGIREGSTWTATSNLLIVTD